MPRKFEPLPRSTVGLVPFEVTSLQAAVQDVIDLALRGGPMPVRLSNAYCVALASREDEYATLLNSPGRNYPDGSPIVWYMRKTRSGRSAQRVRGPSLFRDTLTKSADYPVRHFFLGTTETTLTTLVDQLQKKIPNITVAGRYAPPFAPVDEAMISTCTEKIRQSDANLVWVALGTPKQDYLATALAETTNLPCVGVGAAFDFAAGTAMEAPTWVQRIGMEWLFRLASEPSRLWRRYLIGNAQFLAVATRNHWANR